MDEQPLNVLLQVSRLVVESETCHVQVANYPPTDSLFPTKNGAIATNLWQFYGRTRNLDGHSRTYTGQSVWRLNKMSMLGRNPPIAVINPMMRLWPGTDPAFPSSRIYDISQQNWTGDVQRGRRNMLTGYGKMDGLPQMVYLMGPPGEDTGMFLELQQDNPEYVSTQTSWDLVEWRQPPLYEVTLATEQRYSYNVTRTMLDRSQVAVFEDPNVPVDKKLSNLFLWAHYYVAFNVMALLIFLPGLAPFSAFAFLKPMAFFIPISFVFLYANNATNFLRHWRQTGSFWVAIPKAAWEAFIAAPFYVFVYPIFARGIMLASNEIFDFIRTMKIARMSGSSRDELYDNIEVFDYFPAQRASAAKTWTRLVMGVLALVAVGIWTPLGPLPLLLCSTTADETVTCSARIAAID